MKPKRFDRSVKDRGRGSAQPIRVESWNLLTRVGFRFGFLYLGLFILATQIAGSLFAVPNIPFRGIGQLWPMREITFQFAGRVFGAAGRLDYTGANGETIFFWAQTSWILLVAAIAAGVWSLIDRSRPDYATAHKWFRLLIRFGLAAQMFEYGMTKVIPNQFAAPSLNILATPAGDLSLNTHFWTSIGASPAYQMFTGWAELLGGVLLLIPATTMAGALICLADMIHVFVLNMTFDIGLKLTTFHLILLALFLLAPDMKRLLNFFVLDRVTGASTHSHLFKTAGRNRAAFALQILFGFYLLGVQAWANAGFWYAEGGGAPKSSLHGIWNVERMAVDGEFGPPSLNDYDRQWRRVIFDDPGSVTFQRTDDSFARYGASIDVSGNTIALAKGDSLNWRSEFSFERQADDRLVLDGEMDAHRIHLELLRVEFDTFRLLNSSFRWIRPDGGS